jgi:uncharacterized repeat protein (TIGR03803 family)
MPSTQLPIRFIVALAVISVTLLTTGTDAAAQTETVLYSFSDVNGGTEPFAGLVSDAAGNFYGTTFAGGLYGQGMVFELSPAAGGTWTERVLYSFNPPNHVDGTNPGASLVLDAAGNLYGTTEYGGLHGGGVVFELKPRGNGNWSETVLRHFNPFDVGGYRPATGAGVILDKAGNLYGTTSTGGAHNTGTVFELTNASGVWHEKVIHQFVNNQRDGFTSYAGLIFDAAGNLYGTTCQGGSSDNGTVFEMSPGAAGTWSEKTLYSFGGKKNHYDGACPEASLVMDASGNLYGTTVFGGPFNNYGTVFELSPNPDRGWTEKILHDFNNDGSDGYLPEGNLAIDGAGNLYGLTHNGGANNDGTAFEVKPSAGSWTEKILHNFNKDGVDGYEPVGGLIIDAVGNLYGTTSVGGARGGGAAFVITP